MEPLLDAIEELERMRGPAAADASGSTAATIRALTGFIQGAAAPEGDVEIAPLLLSAVELTRHAWMPYARVEVRRPATAARVRASGRQLGLACVHGLLDTARAIGERKGRPPATPAHIVVHATRRADHVDVTFETDGFRRILQLPVAR